MASRGRLLAELGRAKIAQALASTSENVVQEPATENPTTVRSGPRRKLDFNLVSTNERQPLKLLNGNCQNSSQKNTMSLIKDGVYVEHFGLNTAETHNKNQSHWQALSLEPVETPTVDLVEHPAPVSVRTTPAAAKFNRLVINGMTFCPYLRFI